MNAEGRAVNPAPGTIDTARNGPSHGSRVRDAVEGAAVLDLVVALLEPDVWGDVPAISDEAFPCPECQAAPAARVQSAPAGRLVGGMAWACDRCGVVGTRWRLERQVIENPGPLARLLSTFAA